MGSEVHQRDVLKKVHMKKLLDKVLAGYSSTVMACGQTGSGKTFTMCGQEEVGGGQTLALALILFPPSAFPVRVEGWAAHSTKSPPQ